MGVLRLATDNHHKMSSLLTHRHDMSSTESAACREGVDRNVSPEAIPLSGAMPRRSAERTDSTSVAQPTLLIPV